MSSTDSPPTEAADEAVPARDEVRDGMLASLRAELGDAVIGSHIERGDLWVRVERSAWRRTAEICRDELHCDYFCFLSGIDWLPNPVGNAEKTWAAPGDAVELGEDTTGVEDGAPLRSGLAGGDTRFQVFARFYSTTRHWGVTVKADLDDARPTVESISSVYRGADWHERETWEMYGFDFEGHPRLRHLYLPGEFEGFPLRKDFPLLSREVKPWPGLVDVEPLPGEDPEAAPGEEGGGDT